MAKKGLKPAILVTEAEWNSFLLLLRQAVWLNVDSDGSYNSLAERAGLEEDTVSEFQFQPLAELKLPITLKLAHAAGMHELLAMVLMGGSVSALLEKK